MRGHSLSQRLSAQEHQCLSMAFWFVQKSRISHTETDKQGVSTGRSHRRTVGNPLVSLKTAQTRALIFLRLNFSFVVTGIPRLLPRLNSSERTREEQRDQALLHSRSPSLSRIFSRKIQNRKIDQV